MDSMGSGGLLIAGIALVILGFVLRTGLIQWLIDVTGIILIIIGICLVVWGVFQMFTGRGQGSSMDY